MSEPKRFVTNEKGEPVAVLLGLDEYKQLVEASEELEDIRAYDEAKAAKDPAIPFRQAIEEIERSRK